MEIVKKREHKNQRYFSHLTLDFLESHKYRKKIMKRVFIIFFLCYTHYGFLRFISNDLQYVTKGEWER